MLKINIIFGLSLLLALLGAFIAFTGLYGVEGPFIIHFNDSGVADFIGGGENSKNVTFIGFAILAINFILAQRLRSERAILAYALSWSSLFVNFLALITVYLISRVN